MSRLVVVEGVEALVEDGADGWGYSSATIPFGGRVIQVITLDAPMGFCFGASTAFGVLLLADCSTRLVASLF